MVEEVSTQTVEEQLLAAQSKIVELEAKTKTTLTGSQFLTIVLIGPLFLAFVTLGAIAAASAAFFCSRAHCRAARFSRRLERRGSGEESRAKTANASRAD